MSAVNRQPNGQSKVPGYRAGVGYGKGRAGPVPKRDILAYGPPRARQQACLPSACACSHADRCRHRQARRL